MTEPPGQVPVGGWPAPQGWQRPGEQPSATPPAGGPGLTLPPGWSGPPPAAHEPGVIPLRPLGLDDIFTGTFRTVRRNWRPLAAISGLAAAVASMLSLPIILNAHDVTRAFVEITTVDSSTNNVEVEATFDELMAALGTFWPWLVYGSILAFSTIIFIDAGVSLIVSRAVLGRPTNAVTALGGLMRRFAAVLGLAVVASAAIFTGYLLCVIPGFVLSLMLFASPSALMLEQGSVWQAFTRSLKLTSKAFWRVVGILLLLQLLYSLMTQVASLPFSFVAGFGALGSAAGSEITNGVINLIVLGYLLFWIVCMLCYPLVSVGKTLLYIDVRMRNEGLAETLAASATPGSRTQQ